MRIAGDAASRDGIEGGLSEGLIAGMREIEAADVAVAEPAEITDANTLEDRAGAGVLVDDITDGRGAHEEAVVVIVEAGIVFLRGGDEFRGLAGKNEVLQGHVADKDQLVAPG